MIKLQFPSFDHRIEKRGDKFIIFDVLRKKWLILTPEEWVRQHVVQYLICVLGYPKGMIATEQAIHYGQLVKRFDVLVYQNSKPHILVECKAPDVVISMDAVQQIARYQSVLQAGFIWLTNGQKHYFFEVKDQQAKQVNEIPAWQKKID